MKQLRMALAVTTPFAPASARVKQATPLNPNDFVWGTKPDGGAFYYLPVHQ